MSKMKKKASMKIALILFAILLIGAITSLIITQWKAHKTNTSLADMPSPSPTEYAEQQEHAELVESSEANIESDVDLPTNSTFEIHFFDVGEADSALVECDGHYMLVDGGNSGSSSFLYSYLQQHEITYLDYIICTHAHADHVGGLAGALNYATVGTAYAPVTEYDSRAFNSFVKYLGEQGKEIIVPSVGDTLSLGSATITILGPVDMSLAENNINNSSIVLRIEYGMTSFLFAADAETDEEISLVESGQNFHSTLLKVGHHGSDTSSSQEFLAAVSPQYAVISVGEDNEYGHPCDEILERLSEYCDQVYRTDMNGEIVCRSDGKNLTFDLERNE